MGKLDFSNVSIEQVITHHVGNKLRDEKLQLSGSASFIAGESKEYLLKYFLSSFKTEEVFTFTHAVKVEMNEMYQIAANMFAEPEAFVQNSQEIGKLLYEQSSHPNIKEGQLNVAHFKEVEIDGEIGDAIGIFKSETDAAFLKMKSEHSRYLIHHEVGFDLQDLDKGCLIFKSEDTESFKVLIIDRVSKSEEAKYWKHDFLNVKPLSNEYYQTNQFLGLTKQFVDEELKAGFEVSKTDQIDLLNRTVHYFKNHESFERQQFEEDVFEDPEVIDSFRKYNSKFVQENEPELNDYFDINPQAVKKQSRVYKSVLKLDRNFHIYIHGDKSLIERGVDESGRKFYKVYFEEES